MNVRHLRCEVDDLDFESYEEEDCELGSLCHHFLLQSFIFPYSYVNLFSFSNANMYVSLNKNIRLM